MNNKDYTMTNINDMNYPPVKGEYSYYDSRNTNSNHFMVIINNKEYACQYSMKNKLENIPFVTCHGMIDTIKKEVVKRNSKFIKF